jgi:hypothetical protein
MNEVEKLYKNLEPHILSHQGKDCEVWVNVDGTSYRLTGGVSTYGILVVLFATKTGKPTFKVKMKYYSGKDYPYLCVDCQRAIDEIATLYNEGEMPDTDDPEAPCMYVYDHRMYCDGHKCKKTTD